MKTIIKEALLCDGNCKDTYKLNSQLTEIKDAAGRGQEVRFVDFQFMMKCLFQNCAFVRWYQSKTVTTSLTSIHKGYWDDYYNCQLFNKGLYFMMCNALERPIDNQAVAKDVNDNKEAIVRKCLIKKSWTRLYPDYTHPDNPGAAKGITNVQTKHIRRHCPAQWQSYLSSKSPKIGTVVEMEMSDDLGRHHGVARTGHRDNQNAYDNYAQVPLTIVATAGRVLAGWSFPKTPEVIPCFESLDPRDKDLLVQFSTLKLFGNISIAEFKWRGQHSTQNTGRLLPFLLDISATMLGALHKFADKSDTQEDLYFWYHEYKVRAVACGLFDHIWGHMINPTVQNKLEKMHDYLVVRSKLVHDSWIRERDARDEAC
jgi:hypothetical protein